MIDAQHTKRPEMVLVVDDMEINRDILGMILEDLYEVVYAEDGAQAMQLIEQYRDRLSIILLDLIMPVMDGFEVLAQVRADSDLNIFPSSCSRPSTARSSGPCRWVRQTSSRSPLRFMR